MMGCLVLTGCGNNGDTSKKDGKDTVNETVSGINQQENATTEDKKDKADAVDEEEKDNAQDEVQQGDTQQSEDVQEDTQQSEEVQEDTLKDGSHEHPYEFGDTVVVENVHGTINDKVFKLTITFNEAYPDFTPLDEGDIAYYSYTFKMEGDTPGEECNLYGMFGAGINSDKGSISLHEEYMDGDEISRGMYDFIDGEERTIYLSGPTKYRDEFKQNYIFVIISHGEEDEKICFSIPGNE